MARSLYSIHRRDGSTIDVRTHHTSLLSPAHTTHTRTPIKSIQLFLTSWVSCHKNSSDKLRHFEDRLLSDMCSYDFALIAFVEKFLKSD